MLNFISTYPIELWLFLGLILILIEFTQIPGMGLIFIGFGSFTTALLLQYFPITSNYQIIILGISSLLWLLILWRPMKSLYENKNQSNKTSFNIIGSIVVVVNHEIQPNQMGQVFWSGTVMNAQFISNDNNYAKVGDQLKVIEVKGNVLICQI